MKDNTIKVKELKKKKDDNRVYKKDHGYHNDGKKQKPEEKVEEQPENDEYVPEDTVEEVPM